MTHVEKSRIRAMSSAPSFFRYSTVYVVPYKSACDEFAPSFSDLVVPSLHVHARFQSPQTHQTKNTSATAPARNNKKEHRHATCTTCPMLFDATLWTDKIESAPSRTMYEHDQSKSGTNKTQEACSNFYKRCTGAKQSPHPRRCIGSGAPQRTSVAEENCRHMP